MRRPSVRWLVVSALFLCAIPAWAAEEIPDATPAATATPAAPAIDDPPEVMYRRALDQYEHGDYGPAAAEFQRLLYPPRSGMDPEKTRRAHLYRGISLFLLDEKAGADGEFWAVLLSDPDYAPDPLFTPPAVIAAFSRLRRDNAAELRKVRVTRRRDDPARDPMGIPLNPVRNGESAGEFWWSIAPFGVAQFHNGQPRKAYTLLALEAPLLVANLSSWAAFEALKKDKGRFDPDETRTAQLAKNVNNATFALLIATILYGTADGLWYGSLRASPPPSGPLLTPMAGPGAAGFTMTVRF